MEFTNTLDPEKFRQTNSHWNDLCLNDPWSVGYVSTLIEIQTFIQKEEWEEYYYNSGEERYKKVSNFTAIDQQLLNNHTLKRSNPNEIEKLGWDMKNLNYQYGRTKSQLAEKGKILFEYVTEKGLNITEEECVECVRFRTICETWNGIIIRERNTIKVLNQKFKDIIFVKTDGTFDHKYAVDYEIKKDGKLICGIQIKPKSYTGYAPYITKARSANKRKNTQYQNDFGQPVFDIIAKTNGEVIDLSVLISIEDQIKKQI